MAAPAHMNCTFLYSGCARVLKYRRYTAGIDCAWIILLGLWRLWPFMRAVAAVAVYACRGGCGRLCVPWRLWPFMRAVAAVAV
jgi:hypothetical protein